MALLDIKFDLHDGVIVTANFIAPNRMELNIRLRFGTIGPK